jgi:integrase
MPIPIHNLNGRLRLRWQVKGQRFTLPMGRDTKVNRALAQLKVSEIENDISQGLFDPTLAKYRGQVVSVKSSSIGVVELWQKFLEYKAQGMPKNSLSKYRAMVGILDGRFHGLAAARVTTKDALEFSEWYATQVARITLRERLGMLKAAWAWAISQGWVQANPWAELRPIKDVELAPPRPFSPEEIQLILAAFRGSRYYAYYADYVEFLLGTGCRPGEAVALKWQHVAEDFRSVWIGESWSRGVLKGTKNSKSGSVPLSLAVTELLKRRKPPGAAGTDLVFPATGGGYIKDGDFRNRAWVHCLAHAGVEYRKPYSCRSTLITYWLSQGEDPMVVAKYTRTSVKMIFEHYAGAIETKARLPDILGRKYSEDRVNEDAEKFD